jgi:hypothetical protein
MKTYREPPEQARARAKRWYNAHADRVIARAKAWRLANPERYREIRRLAKRRKRSPKICAATGCTRVVPTLERLIKFCRKCSDFYRTNDKKRRVEVHRDGEIFSSSSNSKGNVLTQLRLKDLPKTEWWTSICNEYPTVDCAAELLKAQDWYRADRVKSPKLFFRNWVARAAKSLLPRELTPDELRARLRVVA